MNFQVTTPDLRFPQALAKSQKLTALEKVILMFLFNNFKGDLTIETLSKYTLEPKERVIEAIKHLIEINLLSNYENEIQVQEQWVTAAGWLPSIKKEVKEKVSKVFVPPTLQEWCKFFAEKGYKREVAENSFMAYDNAKWHDTFGKPVLNWKQKAINVWFKEEHKEESKKKQVVGNGGINV